MSGGFDRRRSGSSGDSTSVPDSAGTPGRRSLVQNKMAWTTPRTMRGLSASFPEEDSAGRPEAGREPTAPEVDAKGVAGSGSAVPYRSKIPLDQLFGRNAGTAPVQRSTDRPEAGQAPAVP